jgi:5'-methylthioadenosine phosphorylase
LVPGWILPEQYPAEIPAVEGSGAKRTSSPPGGEVVLTKPTAEIGIFGGSGLYTFLDGAASVKVETPYGAPSDHVWAGELAGRRVAFMPRHGRDHSLVPHAINYRANLWAMKELGVTRLLTPCASGSLRPGIKPGEMVVCDQLVDRTWGRKDTFYEGPIATHIAFADPFCPELGRIVAETGDGLGLTMHRGGAIVVIQGPRFSTRAESAFYSAQGWDVINMTQYPEAALARELEICCCNISVVTDYDAGLEDVPHVTVELVVATCTRATEGLRRLLMEVIPKIPTGRSCPCSTALRGARLD